MGMQTRERRLITQLQYMAWPDHGVPDSPTNFIQFTADVRRARAGNVEPVLVHCSAGIGRTGVLVLMETALCLIESNEPVYPLDITKTMREQRPMMIQNSVGYPITGPGQMEGLCVAGSVQVRVRGNPTSVQ
jgi:tyrosine-protein phosphatase non-receptor type 4